MDEREDAVAVSVLRFSVFELDLATPELRRSGRRVPLQDMPLRVLQMLLERPNELVPREAFFARLWPHDETGILDDNLNTAVRKLRLALNDSAHHPRFIETVPKRGYRFVGALIPDAEAAAPRASVAADSAPLPEPQAPSSASDAAQHSVERATRRPWLIFAAALSILFIVGAVLLTRWAPNDRPAAAPAHPNTVAVLPFVNASGRAEDEYFSDGLTEELMDRLARNANMRVVSRTSAFALKGKDLGAREIGEMLGAASLVEGSVRRDGERLRISVRLVEASDGFQRWSETFDRRLTDVMDIQQEMAAAIAATLEGRLSGARQAGLEATDADPLAYDSYLKGRFYWHRRTRDSLHAAVEHFLRAVQRSPDYARAWAGLADAYAVLGFYDHLAPEEAFPKAQEAAQRALQLDPQNASAEATMGYATLYYEWDLARAEERFRRAVALDPSYSKAHQWYGNLLTAAGRFPEAEREMRRAQQLEPLSLIASAALGWTLYHAGRHEEALEQYRLTLGLDPDFELAYLWSGWALEALGRYDEALAMLERAGGDRLGQASLARLHALRGERTQAQHVLAELLASDAYVPAYEVSKAYLALGQAKEAEAWLQRALEQRSHSLVFLRVDPQLATHREQPALQRVIARVGI